MPVTLSSPRMIKPMPGITILLLSLLALSSTPALSSAHAACPRVDATQRVFASTVHPDEVVAFEKSAHPDQPLDLVLYRGTESCNRTVIDSYSVESGDPVIESAFPHTLEGQPGLFVIVSWQINNRGIGTWGKLYQIYAYTDDGHGGLVPDEKLLKMDEMTGIEGTADNEASHFQGKNEAEVKALIDRLGLN